jgi:hypothetical protein
MRNFIFNVHENFSHVPTQRQANEQKNSFAQKAENTKSLMFSHRSRADGREVRGEHMSSERGTAAKNTFPLLS